MRMLSRILHRRVGVEALVHAGGTKLLIEVAGVPQVEQHRVDRVERELQRDRRVGGERRRADRRPEADRMHVAVAAVDAQLQRHRGVAAGDHLDLLVRAVGEHQRAPAGQRYRRRRAEGAAQGEHHLVFGGGAGDLLGVEQIRQPLVDAAVEIEVGLGERLQRQAAGRVVEIPCPAAQARHDVNLERHGAARELQGDRDQQRAAAPVAPANRQGVNAAERSDRPLLEAAQLIFDHAPRQHGHGAVATIEEALADDQAHRTGWGADVLERADQLGQAGGAREAAAIADGPVDVVQAGRDRCRGQVGRAAVDPRDHPVVDAGRQRGVNSQRGRGRRRGHAHGQRLAATAVEQQRERGGVRGYQPGADERRDPARPGHHRLNTAITVPSSHATIHRVQATTLEVMPRVTSSASDLGAPPLATTSLAMPQA